MCRIIYEFSFNWNYLGQSIYAAGIWRPSTETYWAFGFKSLLHNHQTVQMLECAAAMLLFHSQVCEEDGGIGTIWLHILHGVPFVDAELAGGHSALVVADPSQEQAAWVVVMATSHLAGFVERLQGGPGDREREDSHSAVLWIRQDPFWTSAEIS